MSVRKKKKCVVCGKWFLTPHLNNQSCSPECREQNKKETKAAWSFLNHDKVINYSKNYYYSHPGANSKRCEIWREENLDHYREYQREYQRKRNDDPIKAYAHRCRVAIRSGLRAYLSQGHNTSWIWEVVGLGPKQLLKWLERDYKQFELNEIDHIVSLNTATTIKEIEKLCHYKNLRLIDAKENKTGCKGGL